jgi:YesN/AraC family two-component response regulator
MEELDRLSKYTVLYVEDEPIIRENITEILDSLFEEVYTADSAIKALEIYSQKHIDLIISDINMPHMNGIDMIKEIRKRDKNISFILTTAYTDKEYLLDAIELNIIKYVVKPLNSTKLIDVLHKFLDKVEEHIITIRKGLYFDSKNYEIVYEQDKYSLTNKETKFIALLISINGVVDYSVLESDLSDYNITSINAIHTLVKKIRKKIPFDFIQNVQGIGYKINRD